MYIKYWFQLDGKITPHQCFLKCVSQMRNLTVNIHNHPLSCLENAKSNTIDEYIQELDYNQLFLWVQCTYTVNNQLSFFLVLYIVMVIVHETNNMTKNYHNTCLFDFNSLSHIQTIWCFCNSFHSALLIKYW